jgi:methyltransferase (TIGR00027 family)
MREGKASRTAMMVAYWRAVADLGITTIPRFSDPAARTLLSGRAYSFLIARAERLARDPDGKGARDLRRWVDGLVLRVAFIDALLTERRAPQVVIVGAGLDTRAWRLDALAGSRLFELDHPATQAYKRERAARLGEPLAEHVYAPIDFTRDDLGRVLAEAGHDPAVPSAWVWEGVTMYLDDAALRSTLRAIRRASAPESLLLAHYHEPRSKRVLARDLFFRWLGEPQIGERSRETMRREIEAAGFEVLEDAGLPEQASRAGAPPPPDTELRVSRIAVARPVQAG